MNLPRPVLLASGFAIFGVVALALQDVVVPWGAQFWGLMNNQIDLAVYRQGAEAVTEGANLYDVKMIGDLDYTYSPFSALLFTPLALISFDVARWIWTIGIVVALYAVVMLSFRALGRTPTWPLRVVAMSLVAASMLLEPVRTTIWYGQINVFLMLLILADLTRPDTSRTKGFGAGIAAGIKLTPLIFAGYYAVQRNWRAFSGVLGGFALTVLVGFAVLPRDSWAYWTDKLFQSERVGSAQLRGNQSLRGMLANHLDTDHPPTLLYGGLALAALVAGFAVATYAHRKGQELLALSIVGMTACVVSPMSWGHHWVWFVPVIVIGVHLALDARLDPVRRGLAAAGAIALFLIVFAWPTHVPELVPDAYYTGLYVKTRVTWMNWFTVSPYLWCYLGILVAAVVALRVSGRRGATADPTAPVIAKGVAAAVIADGGLPAEPAASSSDGDVGPVDTGTRDAAARGDDLVGTAGEPMADNPDTGATPAV
ncbi:glycosyltransferase [Gordonia paraffinivorans]|uniref:glycosyltransferase 87 family protein n=1 Tax=Gordonia paraffinivorans TaxID=175628 RepID=UPI001C930468|nr:glycosyltransferase 87 family protein [Gordonia paraffinivorans]MBY4574493.1 glycosyltransferase [Gordonia paraffinivorans]